MLELENDKDKKKGVEKEKLIELVHFLYESLNTKIDDSEFEPKREANQTWGAYGWTWLPDINSSIYDESPKSQEEADAIMEPECSKKVINGLLDEMYENGYLLRTDYNAVKSNLEQGFYKVVALIVFTYIDNNLISRQRDEDRGRRQLRPHGSEATINVIRHFYEDEFIAKRAHLVLRYENIITCAKEMFATGSDFIDDRPVINRNYLMHGFLPKVSKKDAYQVILFYYNMMVLFDLIDDIGKEDYPYIR